MLKHHFCSSTFCCTMNINFVQVTKWQTFMTNRWISEKYPIEKNTVAAANALSCSLSQELSMVSIEVEWEGQRGWCGHMIWSGSGNGHNHSADRVNFLCWLLFGVQSTPVLPQWHVKGPGHSAKSAGGRLHLNMHTLLTQQSLSGLTMLSSIVWDSSGNTQPQSSQLTEPLWTDPGVKSGISVCELISVLILVSWYFEPSQPQRVTSWLKTMFNLSSIYSARKSSNHKLSINHKISRDTNLHKTKHTQTSDTKLSKN